MKSIDVQGRCPCGRATFRLREEPIAFYLCHCTDCQAESSSAFGMTMQVRSDAIADVEGATVERTVEGSRGDTIALTHCANCMTMLFGGRADVPQVRGVNAGALDATAGLEPYGNMWTRSARPWVSFAPGACFEQNPDEPLDMIRIWQGRPGQGS